MALPLCLEQLSPKPLEVLGAQLDRAVVAVVEAGPEAVGPEAVEAAHALGGVVAHPVLDGELLEPRDRGFRGADARLRVLSVLASILLETERADHERERQALADERCEDHREREEEDEIAPRKRRSGVRLEREGECRRE